MGTGVTGRWAAPLFLGAFVVGCTEFVVVGMLPQIARGVGASHAAVGQLVTVNAVAVVVAAPLVTSVFAGASRRRLLVWSMLAFAVAHLASALAGSLLALVVLRVLGGVAFGTWMATALSTAGRLAA